MGEIFRREIAEHPEPFTGERLTTAIGGQVQVEHYHRYLLARSLARGREVLDVASGEGYGSALLAQVARSVVGVEYSGPTASTAAANFPRDNLRFLQGDARALPLADGSVDLAVSFETIEHFDRQDDFLREMRRVLRPDGCCIISTPDRDVYSPLGSAANPYHVQELTLHEFAELLRAEFRHVALMRQRVLIGSALLADTGSAAPPLVFDRRGDTHFEACTGLPRAHYIVAVASNRELSALPPSLYIHRSDLDTDRVRIGQLDARIAELAAQLSARGGELGQMRDQVAAALTELAQAKSDLQQASERARDAAQAHDDALERAADHAASLQRQLDHMGGSLRTFARVYLPHLSRYIRGRRN